MRVEHKDATITPTGADEDFPGTFEVILSAPTLDRDGDTLGSDEWKTPLPEKITFDSDHGMSVATTVGSGVPSINEAGQLVVSGTYSSLPRAQEVRTLVNEGHINTTSVAFMTLPKTSKDAKPQRELLNGAFVAIPSNREALVLSSKSGARNSKSDAAALQAIHDHAVSMGATCVAEKSHKSAETEPIDAPEVVDALDVVGIPDPDENAEPAAELDTAAAAEKSAAAAVETKAADEAESEAVTAAFVDLYADILIP
ncbi:MAG: hypothetical protein H7288_11395 [Kineosporiaceae bacterium]|nr:hypothetical protein [Aeromicrobium sp.]